MDLTVDEILDIDSLEAALPALTASYATASPFPHIVLDDLLRPEIIGKAHAEFGAIDESSWTNYLHLNERKYANTDPETWGHVLRTVSSAFTSERFVAFLSQLTGFDSLRADPAMDGGGLHRSVTGGFLNVHTDFTAHHTELMWRRRVNLLLYLNEDWRPEWAGDLELWSVDMQRCERRIAPVGNRLLLFTTGDRSFHGHPEPLRCPEGTARQSMALYYFTQEVEPHIRSTHYRARPGDGAKAAVIFADNQALHAYDALKRRLRLSDKAVSRVLGGMSRLLRSGAVDTANELPPAE